MSQTNAPLGRSARLAQSISSIGLASSGVARSRPRPRRPAGMMGLATQHVQGVRVCAKEVRTRPPAQQVQGVPLRLMSKLLTIGSSRGPAASEHSR